MVRNNTDQSPPEYASTLVHHSVLDQKDVVGERDWPHT
jgi:hypothetical protein